MAFNPQGTVWLCSVPFDITYQHQYQFMNTVNRDRYFLSEGVLKDTLSEYVTIREPLRGGGERSKIRAGRNIEAIRAKNINYMVYCNEHHGTRKFFAFITDLIYVNENMTEIVFETDVYQTWFYDCTVHPSFVVREHSATDKIGDNIVPEKFTFEDYEYHHINDASDLDDYGWLIVASEPLYGFSSRGELKSGNYQGLYFYYGGTASQVNTILDALEEAASDCILSITYIPKFCLDESSVGIDDNASKGVRDNVTGQVFLSTKPAEANHELDLSGFTYTFGGYSPRNNKLYTSQYAKLVVSNHAGNEAEYTLEDFTNPNKITFKIYGDVSVNPSVTAIPLNYKGIGKAYDFAISLAGFPQSSYNNDSFKLWLNKNMPSLKRDAIMGTAMMLPLAAAVAAAAPAAGLAVMSGGVALGAGGGLATGVGIGAVGAGVSGANKVFGAIDSVYRASKEPNIAHMGNPSNNLQSVLGFNNFSFYIRTIKKDYAETVDNFFTMYGYQTNKVKMPNFNARLNFNYIQTEGMNISVNPYGNGGVPNDDMVKLKAIFDKGITLWRSTCTIGNYSVDNPCMEEL